MSTTCVPCAITVSTPRSVPSTVTVKAPVSAVVIETGSSKVRTTFVPSTDVCGPLGALVSSVGPTASTLSVDRASIASLQGT